ncbi:hypothetical protein FACS189479_02190 [Spirochaetia bacterium]|nr:hypothetical protein FACS189479_02190 [Spirochaetia bacterium]
MREKLLLLETILKNFGVSTVLYDGSLSGIEKYDNGLRSKIFQTFDFKEVGEFFSSIESGHLYFTEDQYNCRHCFFRLDLPDENNEKAKQYCSIGPWIEVLPDAGEIDGILAENKVPYHLKPELTQYFNCLPIIPFHQSWEGLVVTITEYLLDHSHKLGITYLKFDPGIPITGYIPKQDSSLSLHLIEEIYNTEDALLEAIKAGDTKRALQCIANVGHYNVSNIGDDKVRSGKNYLMVFNALARKAVQKGAVHPIHIHTVSSDFSEKIEAAKKIEDLYSMVEIMIRRYCALVREHSLARFSTVVQNVINYVEFNLKEPLSCNILAKQFYIDPSNLSHHFIREMGVSITDFIRLKRLEYAKHLLAGSGMYIQEIAEECGFDDGNYFCRLFKRQYGKTPRQYRSSLHIEE